MPATKMKAIIFLERQEVKIPPKPDLVFEKGSVHELVNTSADRWIRRGVALELTDEELKEHRKAIHSKPKGAAAGGVDGNTVDGTKAVAGQNGGGDGQRTEHDAGGGFLSRVIKRVFGGDQ